MSEPALKRSLSKLSCSLMPLLVTAGFLLGCAGPPRHATWKTATGAGEYERLMWEAIQKKDWKEFEYHLAPTFVGVNASGKALDRDGWVEYWKSAPIQEALRSEIEVRPAGESMVVTFVLRLSGLLQPASPGNQVYRVVSVWQQVKGGWTLTATSITPTLPE